MGSDEEGELLLGSYGQDHRAEKDRRKERKDLETLSDNHNTFVYRKQKEHHRWLVPNIRVRVVSKKLKGGCYYRHKGVVLDVIRGSGGDEATIQMDCGSLIARIAECYLETALPKAGRNVVILAGSHVGEKGRLLERDSDKCRGVIQLFEDMDVVTPSLDDIAEWCGPIEE